MCWAFNLVPSQLDDLFWKVSYHDLKTKIGLRTEEKLIENMQIHESMALVVSAALGGSKGNRPKSTADPANAPKTVSELEARLQRVLG